MNELEKRWAKYLNECDFVVPFEELGKFDFKVNEKIRSNYDNIPLQIMMSKYPGNYFIIMAFNTAPNCASCALQRMIQETIKDLCFDCL